MESSSAMGTLVEEMGKLLEKGSELLSRAGNLGGGMEVPRHDTEWAR
jgi:hypothetical protein